MISLIFGERALSGREPNHKIKAVGECLWLKYSVCWPRIACITAQVVCLNAFMLFFFGGGGNNVTLWVMSGYQDQITTDDP